MELGWDPPQGALLLPVGGPFTCTLKASADWPVGTVIDLHFTGTGSPVTWTATIAGDEATWTKTIAEVATVLAADLGAVALRGQPSGGEPAIWYRLAVRPV